MIKKKKMFIYVLRLKIMNLKLIGTVFDSRNCNFVRQRVVGIKSTTSTKLIFIAPNCYLFDGKITFSVNR